MPICTRYTLADLTPKYPTLATKVPPGALQKIRYILFLSTVVTLKHNIILRTPTEQQHDMTCELCTSFARPERGGGVSPRL